MCTRARFQVWRTSTHRCVTVDFLRVRKKSNSISKSRDSSFQRRLKSPKIFTGLPSFPSGNRDTSRFNTRAKPLPINSSKSFRGGGTLKKHPSNCPLHCKVAHVRDCRCGAVQVCISAGMHVWRCAHIDKNVECGSWCDALPCLKAWTSDSFWQLLENRFPPRGNLLAAFCLL